MKKKKKNRSSRNPQSNKRLKKVKPHRPVSSETDNEVANTAYSRQAIILAVFAFIISAFVPDEYRLSAIAVG